MLSPKQRKLFWSVFSAAADNLGYADKAAREDYRHQVMREETGHVHLADLGRGDDYDRVMLRLGIDAEDYGTVDHFAAAGERRLALMIADEIRQLSALLDREIDPVSYVEGILRQARMCHSFRTDSAGGYWLDLTREELASVLKMLDTARRRLSPHKYVYGLGLTVTSDDGVTSSVNSPWYVNIVKQEVA